MFTTRATARLINRVNRISKCNNLHTNRKYKNINQNNQDLENIVKNMQKELSEIKNINKEIHNNTKPIETTDIRNILPTIILVGGIAVGFVAAAAKNIIS